MKRKIYFTALALLVSTAFNVNGADWPDYGMSGYGDGTEEFGEPLIKRARAEEGRSGSNSTPPTYKDDFGTGLWGAPCDDQPYFTDSADPYESFFYDVDTAHQHMPTPVNEDSSTHSDTVPTMAPQDMLAPADEACGAQPANSAVPSMEPQWMQIPADLVRQLESLDESKPAIIIGDTVYIYYYSNTSEDCLRSLYYSIKSSTKYLIVRKTNTGKILTCIPIQDAKTRRSVIVFPGSDGSYKMDTELNFESFLKAKDITHLQESTQKSISTASKIISKGPHDPVPAEFANIDTPTVGGDRLYLPGELTVQDIDKLLECLYGIYIREVCIRTLLGNYFFVNEINTLNDKGYMHAFTHSGKMPAILTLSRIARYLTALSELELSQREKAQKARKARKARAALASLAKLRDFFAVANSATPAPEER